MIEATDPHLRLGITTMPNPSGADLSDPLFEAIWQEVKSWDVNVPRFYAGYCGASGSHVMLILNAVRAALAAPPPCRVDDGDSHRTKWTNLPFTNHRGWTST